MSIIKIKLFKQVIKKFSKKEKQDKIIVTEDKRLRNILAYASQIKIKNKKYWKIAFNAEAVSSADNWRIIHIALHEFGHIVTNAKTAVDREYRAEVYALTMIKKYYSSHYQECCEMDLKYVITQEVKYGIAFKKALKTLGYK